MITESGMTIAGGEDAELVAQSLSGNREAFGEIVARYQSLICSLAYSATGSLSYSEDLAQETFVHAWKQLRQLREPLRCRPWLCGIARNVINNWLRRQGREPAHVGEDLESIRCSPGNEPLPYEQAISREEEAILWRSLETMPEIYREPLVLFYRERRSIESVAGALDLTEEAVKQRLSRGRKLLHEQVLQFVEGALERSKPGRTFTIGVLSALPMLAGSASAATIGASAAQGSSAAKGAAIVGGLGAFMGLLTVVFGSWIGYRISLTEAGSENEKRLVKGFYWRLTACIVIFLAGFTLFAFWAARPNSVNSQMFTPLFIGLVAAYAGGLLLLMGWFWRRSQSLSTNSHATYSAPTARSPREYRSRIEWLGLPLVHIRLGGGAGSQQKPVRAWIAAGDCAFGVIFAFGGCAVAPVCMGGAAVGLLPLGGFALGLLPMGGLSIGYWAFGGVAAGYLAYGGFALAWQAAVGGVAMAHEFALGGVAQAIQANNETAARFIRGISFFHFGEVALRYLFWINLLWVVPMIVWWRTVVRRGRSSQ